MADVKLVVSIPENYDLSKIHNGSIASRVILNAIAKGTPLANVIDTIKAEIMHLDYDVEDIDYDYNDMAMTEVVHTICREEVLRIIDEHKS